MSSYGFSQNFDNNNIGSGGFGGGFSYAAMPQIVTAGLVVSLDAALLQSYPESGTTWYDLSGNGNNATLVNSPTYTKTNKGELRFNKTSYQHATIPDIGSKTKWTVETWIKYASSPPAGTAPIVTNAYDGSNLNFSLGTNDPLSTAVKAGFFTPGAWHNTTTGVTVIVGNWYHFVGTYDGATVILYSNNSVAGTLNYVGTPASGGEIRIARRWDAPANDQGNYTDGTIPIVRIYDRALSASEVTQNYNATKSRYGL